MLASIMLPTRRSDVACRIVDDEVVILDRATGHVHRLNPTASCIWNHCDGLNTPEAIAGYLAEDFNQSPDAVVKDVIDTIQKLRRLGLLVDESTPRTPSI
jgi:hypothetical protein